ncbi:MAG: AI-2E family transporter [Myxococcales bacterium]|nr:AI-2E family transporter [Myxococcales bacterium]
MTDLKHKAMARRSHRYFHLLFGALILLAVFAVIRGLGAVLAPVVAALVLSYLLDPIVGWLERRARLPRWAGTLVLFLLGLLVVVVVFVLVVPRIVREIGHFAAGIEVWIRKARVAAVPWIERTFGIDVPDNFGQLSDRFGADAKALLSRIAKPLGGVAGKVAQGTAGALSAVGTLVLVPVFTFYFLPKFPAIVRGASELIPRRYIGWVSDTACEIDANLSAWLRGQLTVIAILAVLYSTGLLLMKVKMAVLIGTMTAMMAFIPYVGVAIGVTVALLVCLIDYSGPGQIFGVLAVFGVVQALEGMVLTPFLVGDKVGLGPVGVLLALMIGGKVFGFVGVLLAVPTAAALVVILRRGLSAYRESRFYQQSDVPLEKPPDAPPGEPEDVLEGPPWPPPPPKAGDERAG